MEPISNPRRLWFAVAAGNICLGIYPTMDDAVASIYQSTCGPTKRHQRGDNFTRITELMTGEEFTAVGVYLSDGPGPLFSDPADAETVVTVRQ